METGTWICLAILVITILYFSLDFLLTERKKRKERRKEAEKAEAVKKSRTARSRVNENGKPERIWTTTSRINDFIEFIKNIFGDTDIYIKGDSGWKHYQSCKLSDWTWRVENIIEIFLFVENTEPNGKVTWRSKYLSIKWADADFRSDRERFYYAFENGFPDFRVKITNRSLLDKAEKFSRLYKEKFGKEVREIIIDD